jgi:hypothetical protein
MATWKVLFIMLFAGVCFGLVIATLVVTLALEADQHKWLWFGGLLVASICMSTLFALYLRREDGLFRPGR